EKTSINLIIKVPNKESLELMDFGRSGYYVDQIIHEETGEAWDLVVAFSKRITPPQGNNSFLEYLDVLEKHFNLEEVIDEYQDHEIPFAIRGDVPKKTGYDTVIEHIGDSWGGSGEIVKIYYGRYIRKQ